MEGRNVKHWKKSERGKAKDIFPFCTGACRYACLSSKRIRKKRIYVSLLFFTSYLAERCLLSSAKGASLRCRKKRGFQGNVRKQARASLKERLRMRRILHRAYVFDIRRRESKEELAFISGITRVPRSYHLMELSLLRNLQ